MYLNFDNFKPTRRYYYFTVFLSFSMSIYFIGTSEYNDESKIGIWLLIGSFLYLIFGIIILINTSFRDKIFGKSICPHCKVRAWDIKEKLKITSKQHTNFGECSNCHKKGKVAMLSILPFLLIMFNWVFILLITDNIDISFFVTYSLGIIYFMYYSRYVEIK